MHTIQLIVGAIIVGHFFVAPSFGGRGEVNADEPDVTVFGDHALSVIVARVHEAATLTDLRIGTHALTLQPLATLAGSLDPTAERDLHIRLWAGKITSSIDAAPTVGSIIIVVIGEFPVLGDVNNLFMYATPDTCDFMPDQSGLVVVDSLSDKRVAETTERIRAGRARERARRAAKTQPATAPAPAKNQKK